MIKEDKKVLVTFSGGRDSSAAALELARDGYQVLLFTFQGGLSELTGHAGDSAPDIRHKEINKAYPNLISKDRIMKGSTYLIRKLAIEKTNSTHVVYPLALILTVQSEAIVHCIKNNISNIAVGYSGYQADLERYIEQNDKYTKLLKIFLNEFGIELHTPVINKSKEDIIDILEKNGVSSNSLENKSVFGAIPFETDKAENFWHESLPICREYIKHHTK